MNAKGFSAIELSVVLSVAAIMIPIVYQFAGHIEDQSRLGHWLVESADGVRAISEELRLDATRGLAAEDSEVAFVVGECHVRYVVNDEAVLVRQATDACGGARGLATAVEQFSWSPGGVEIVFVRPLRPGRAHRTSVFIPVEGQ